MFKIFNDNRKYQSYWIDNEDYLDLLDPTIGEQTAMFIWNYSSSIREFWQSLDVTLFHNEGTVDIPDISEWNGMLCMNEKSYDALHEYLDPYGEFLPCNILGKQGYLFHCMNIRQFKKDEVEYITHNGAHSDLKSVSFPKNMKDHVITGINEICPNIYLSDEVVRVIHQENIKGLFLTKELGVLVPNRD